MGDESSKIAYWEDRVMVHKTDGMEEFGIHEVYFGEDGEVVTYTEDVLSPRAGSVEELKRLLLELLDQEGDEVVSGDFGYSYPKEVIRDWLDCVDEPVLEYRE